MDVVFLITTHNRQESCQRLVDSLQGQGEIIVLNDGCDYDISGATQTKREIHFGKRGYWRTVNQLFAMKGKHQYYFMLPDDFLPANNMVERAIEIWKQLDKPICLNLYADRIGQKCWTNFPPKDMGIAWKTQWVDMCFMSQEGFFARLGKIPPINLNWTAKPNLSSGVGAYISRELHKHKYNLYMVKESLVIPQQEHYMSSQMFAL
ncbi:MAG: glycosyltransferase [Candidatus Paceibacterota bacterium]|jgi:glycosyltransferase involved in cell wall biosynthesis